jgi:Cu/Ag efflux protein CusF
MKNLFNVLIGLIFVFSMTGLSIAQEKAKPEKAPEAVKPEAAKQEVAKKETSAEPMEYRVGGVITNISAAGKQITIKQQQVKRERVVTLMISGKTAKDLSNLKVGDSVNVWVKGKRITALQKVS